MEVWQGDRPAKRTVLRRTRHNSRVRNPSCRQCCPMYKTETVIFATMSRAALSDWCGCRSYGPTQMPELHGG